MSSTLPAQSPRIEEASPPPAVDEEPDWIGEGLRLWLGELRLFGRTAWALATSPRRFAREWSSGARPAMNPLGFLAATWPILLPADYGLQRLLGWDRRPSVSFWVELARSLRPYLFAVPACLLAHLVFRLLGSRRRLSSTLAVYLYATVFCVLGWVFGLLLCLPTGLGPQLPRITSALFTLVGAFALEGLHRVRWWWCALVLLGSLFAATYGINFLLDHARLS